MSLNNYYIDWLSPTNRAMNAWKAFIARNGLRFEGAFERVCVAYEGAEIVGCAALNCNVIKYVSVDSGARESGLASRLISFIVEYALSAGESPLFLFTPSERASGFVKMGFLVISSYAGVTFLEYGSCGISAYARALASTKVSGLNGAVVMNANPFTIGHRYLLERASKNVDRVHVFIVSGENGVFPYDVRLSLVREGVSDMKNVFVHEGSVYVLSAATFPAYFNKTANEASVWQAGLDVSVFADHIAPALNIRARFVGDESEDSLTKAYNEKMREILAPRGIEILEFERLRTNGEAVSACKVRKLLSKGDIVSAKRFLPDCTARFLDSKMGTDIIGRLKHENC